MGLDICFFKRDNKGVAKAKEEAENKDKDFWVKQIKQEFFLDEVSNADYEKLLPTAMNNFIYIDNMKTIASFRKVNFLLPYFGYEENCSDLEIGKDKIEALVADCEKELNHEDVLTPQGGFFFGNTAKNEYFYEDVKSVKETFTNILKDTDWENEIIVMSCWW